MFTTEFIRSLKIKRSYRTNMLSKDVPETWCYVGQPENWRNMEMSWWDEASWASFIGKDESVTVFNASVDVYNGMYEVPKNKWKLPDQRVIEGRAGDRMLRGSAAKLLQSRNKLTWRGEREVGSGEGRKRNCWWCWRCRRCCDTGANSVADYAPLYHWLADGNAGSTRCAALEARKPSRSLPSVRCIKVLSMTRSFDVPLIETCSQSPPPRPSPKQTRFKLGYLLILYSCATREAKGKKVRKELNLFWRMVWK